MHEWLSWEKNPEPRSQDNVWERKGGSDAPFFEEQYDLSTIKPDSKCVLGFD